MSIKYNEKKISAIGKECPYNTKKSGLFTDLPKMN